MPIRLASIAPSASNPVLAAGVVGLLLVVFNINFFRDPERTIPADPRAIVSPADGKVVEVDFLHDTAAFGS